MSSMPCKWAVLVGVLAVSGCATSVPTPEQYREAVKGKPMLFGKTETFTLPKPFSQVMAATKPQFERCFNYTTPGMMTREVLPGRREGIVTLKGPGKAEFVYRDNRWIIAIADVEAAGNSTKVTVFGPYEGPVARSFQTWTNGDTSCPVALETPFGVF